MVTTFVFILKIWLITINHLQYGVIFGHVFLSPWGHKRMYIANARSFKGYVSCRKVTTLASLWLKSWRCEGAHHEGVWVRRQGAGFGFPLPVTKSCDIQVNWNEGWRTYSDQSNPNHAYWYILTVIIIIPNMCLTKDILCPDCDNEWFHSLWKYRMQELLYFTH